MSSNAGGDASDGVSPDGERGELPVAEGIQHGGVGAQVAAPAHADGRANGDGVTIHPAGGDEAGHQAQGSPYSPLQPPER